MPEKRKEVKMSKSVVVNVSANDLWQVVGPGFAETGKPSGRKQARIKKLSAKAA